MHTAPLPSSPGCEGARPLSPAPHSARLGQGPLHFLYLLRLGAAHLIRVDGTGNTPIISLGQEVSLNNCLFLHPLCAEIESHPICWPLTGTEGLPHACHLQNLSGARDWGWRLPPPLVNKQTPALWTRRERILEPLSLLVDNFCCIRYCCFFSLLLVLTGIFSNSLLSPEMGTLRTYIRMALMQTKCQAEGHCPCRRERPWSLRAGGQHGRSALGSRTQPCSQSPRRI